MMLPINKMFGMVKSMVHLFMNGSLDVREKLVGAIWEPISISQKIIVVTQF